jgi:xanthine dehydrogenase accessory factor
MFLDKQLLDFVEKNINLNLDFVVTSVIQTTGSTYAKSGNMIIVNSKDEFCGVLGSPHLHNKIIELSHEALLNKKINVFESIPKDESSGHGTSKFFVQAFFSEENYGALGKALNNFGKTLIRSIKDGSSQIVDEVIDTKLEDVNFYQTIQKPYSLLIFGSGTHVSSVVSMANLMGWETTILDMQIKKEFVKQADKLIHLAKLEDIFSMDLNVYDAAIILSHSPKTDETYLKALVDSNVEYIGMMGNKKNMKNISKKFELENDNRFFAPIGLDIGGNTHQSVALSICSQIEARKNKKI